MAKVPAIDGFKKPFEFGSSTKLPVYVSEKGQKPLLVLHELPGMTPSFIVYCQKMAAQGFKVYMPLLFKSPETEMNTLETAFFCMSREFRSLFTAKDKTNTRPFTAWLLDLVEHVGEESPDSKIGVVGMCLTGGFAIAAIAKPQVNAVAACQPSMPFFSNIETLGLSTAERNDASAGAQEKTSPCVKGYRYQKDRISREEHMKAASNLLGSSFERYPDLPGKGHSTLTGKTANLNVYEDVLDFMTKRL